MKRKGMGKGQGKGYKNMVGKDPMVHSQSAKGMKQPQKINIKPIAVGLSQEEADFISNFSSKTFYALKKEFPDTKIRTFTYEGQGEGFITFEDGTEYRIFDDEETAERVAEEQVREDLENEPELFNQDFLQYQKFYTMSDTDRRMLADDLSRNYPSDIRQEDDGERLADEAGYSDELAEIQERIDETENMGEMNDLEQEKEQLLDTAEEELREKMYDEAYEELSDPFEYLVNQQGLYTAEEYYKSGLVSLDVEEATEESININGWQHFLASYDGNSIDLNDGSVMVRVN